MEVYNEASLRAMSCYTSRTGTHPDVYATLKVIGERSASDSFTDSLRVINPLGIMSKSVNPDHSDHETPWLDSTSP